MKQEIETAVDFLFRMVRISANHDKIPAEQIEMFRGNLQNAMQFAYKNCWFPATPLRGSAYRCIRINHMLDPMVQEAGEAANLPKNLLRTLFPPELTVWIDPKDVSYRFGEDGSINSLAMRESEESDADSGQGDEISSQATDDSFDHHQQQG